MCLQAQGIDDNDGGIGRVIRACGLSNDDVGLGRGRRIHDTSKGLETTTEALRIQGQQQRPQRHDEGTKELATTTKASAEEDDPEVSTATTEGRLGKHKIQRHSLHCLPQILAAYVVVSDPSDASSIPCPLPTPPSSLLSFCARLTLPTTLSSLSIP